ncbi:MAG: diguanylate cyclase [gamma proteobacterium symbiont of Taylorina sp.]|nr:diguanylate cyclase [gamma proteobacterium symbiont of Taylorina sp.]
MNFYSIKDKIISNSIAISFGFIIILMLGQAILSIWRFNEVKTEFERVVDVYNVRMELVQKMRVISRERAPILFTMINTEDAFDLDDLLIQFQHLGSQFLSARNSLLLTGLSETETKILEEHREYARSIVPGQRKVIDLISEGEILSARKLLVDKVSPEQIEALKKLDMLITYESKKSRQAMEKARGLFENTQRDLGLTTIIGSLISILIGIIVSIRFAYYVKTLKKNKEELEKTVTERTKELVDSNKQLEHIANYDSLTQLPNRALFIVLLEQALKQAKRSDYSVALLFIDLDGFKSINDTYGHNYGDELLRQVATSLQATVREADTVFRLGGDEFTLILSNFHALEDVEKIARKIIKILSEPFDIIDQQCQIGSSIGIAFYPEHAKNLDELIKKADTVMYDVKNSGKNNYKIYQP